LLLCASDFLTVNKTQEEKIMAKKELTPLGIPHLHQHSGPTRPSHKERKRKKKNKRKEYSGIIQSTEKSTEPKPHEVYYIERKKTWGDSVTHEKNRIRQIYGSVTLLPPLLN